MENKNIIRLNDIISDWNNYRLECMENMFYQCKYGKQSAFIESANNYKFAIDKYTELYQKRLYIKYKAYLKDV